jgi:hypothetical protein
MRDQDYIAVPLYGRDGRVKGHTKVSTKDRHLAELGWSLRTGGYVGRTVWIQGASYSVYLHRLILGISRDDSRQGDHVNRDRLDNRRENLRIVTAQENYQNLSPRHGASKHRGVGWDGRRRRWHARATVQGVRHHLGYHKTEEAAHLAVRAFREAHLPFSTED